MTKAFLAKVLSQAFSVTGKTGAMGFRMLYEFRKATEILKEYGADGWVVKYEKELAALS